MPTSKQCVWTAEHSAHFHYLKSGCGKRGGDVGALNCGGWQFCPFCGKSYAYASRDPYKAVCQGGSGGKCTQPDCEICWPDETSDRIRPTVESAAHESTPAGCRCADCTIDGEACPTCYAVWWRKRHPNVRDGRDPAKWCSCGKYLKTTTHVCPPVEPAGNENLGPEAPGGVGVIDLAARSSSRDPDQLCKRCRHSYGQHTKGPVTADYCRHCACPQFIPCSPENGDGL